MKISLYIVEDYLLNRVNLRHSLNKFDDVEVIGEFETAEDCIEKMQTRPCDIVLMDLGLPCMNGIDATKHIKNNFPDTKIIVLTSHDNDNTVLAALAAGANAYCLKDSDENILIDIIKTVNSGALWLTPKIAAVPANHLPKPRVPIVKNIKFTDHSDIKLSERELSVLKLMAEGKSNPEIAKECTISTHTAKAHVASILAKLGVDDRVQASVKAVKAKLI